MTPTKKQTGEYSLFEKIFAGTAIVILSTIAIASFGVFVQVNRQTDLIQANTMTNTQQTADIKGLIEKIGSEKDERKNVESDLRQKLIRLEVEMEQIKR